MVSLIIPHQQHIFQLQIEYTPTRYFSKGFRLISRLFPTKRVYFSHSFELVISRILFCPMLNKAAASSSVRLTFSHIGIFTVLNYFSSFGTVALAFGGGMNRFRRFRESYNHIICTCIWRGDYGTLTRGKIIEVKCFKSP